MNPYPNPISRFRAFPVRHRGRYLPQRGFALIISLTLMVLLVVLGVGLLSLSSLSLSTSKQISEQAEARANARLALAMALGQLQRYTGPDQRITAGADQLADSADGGQSAAAQGRRHWTGAYRSWDATTTARPDPEFLSWLVSGKPEEMDNLETAKSSASPNGTIELVGEGTVGEDRDNWVQVPALEVATPRGSTARIAWWTGDQGVKATLTSPHRELDETLAGVRAGLQGATRSAVELASIGTIQPFAGIDPNDPRLQLITGWQHSAFFASDPTAPRPLFHDIAPYSSGLLTNVRSGGFRKDLSMELERPANRAPDATRTALYRVRNETGINLQELWLYYNLHKELRPGRGNFTTGGRMAAQTPALYVEGSPAACARDDEFYIKQPVVIAYQMVLSFETRAAGGAPNRLHVVADPVLTFWNPLDVPVVVPTSSFFSVKYWQIPYDLHITTSGGKKLCPLMAALTNTDSNYLSLRAGDLEQLVFQPGEVIKVSQSGNAVGRSSDIEDHDLQGRSGFNYGGGVSLPVRTNTGGYVDLKEDETFTYEAHPNGLTSGKTSSSGNVGPSGNPHTRHFSLTHHEYYVGRDRGTSAESLGIGGIYLDWDFGNRRVKPSETRGSSQPGTKASGHRLYANKFPDIFVPLAKSETRPLMAAGIKNTKAPFMMLSYHAKTEDSPLGTRTLARMNPAALHVDFYDLSQQERDMLAYEFEVIPLTSWRNRSLEVSTNGNAYFGGGMTAESGSTHVTTHSIPREPIWSLAAFQHAFANGFEFMAPKPGYATLNGREPLLPQISHAIGNSTAPSIMGPDETEGVLSGGRPIADHSYLANLALWDDWFLSGIADLSRTSFEGARGQRTVAEEFFNGEAPLAVCRYLPDVGGEEEPSRFVASLFSGSVPNSDATFRTAPRIRVEGMFNVNSTSVEAWKALLGSTRRQPVVVRDQGGSESTAASTDATPVAGMHAPLDMVAPGTGNADIKDPSQWTGRRELNDDEIDDLAQAIVRQVRKRGPFLSLADFVNRRVGRDEDLARSGAIQSALDDPEVAINEAYNGGRGVASDVAGRFEFSEAEEGPISTAIPGIVKQADLLTPIAPILSARSDSFIIRAYGETTDTKGKVVARAWCEAVVERNRDFLDSEDEMDVPIDQLGSTVNEEFGRRYDVVSFRWLHPEEI